MKVGLSLKKFRIDREYVERTDCQKRLRAVVGKIWSSNEDGGNVYMRDFKMKIKGHWS